MELVDAAGKKASLTFRACGRKTPDNAADCIDETIQRGIPVNLPEDARPTSRLGRDIDRKMYCKGGSPFWSH